MRSLTWLLLLWLERKMIMMLWLLKEINGFTSSIVMAPLVQLMLDGYGNIGRYTCQPIIDHIALKEVSSAKRLGSSCT